MKILIDIGHPAHVHLFKNFAHEMMKKGSKVLFTLRQKEFSEQLLKEYGFKYVRYGSSYSGIAWKLWGLLKFNSALFKIVRQYKPDITISHSSFYLAQVSWLLGIKNITLEDTGNMEQIALYKTFTNCILSPDCYTRNHGEKHFFYRGYHELAYLHPNVFIPNIEIIQELGLRKEEKSILFRFVSWYASHDVGQGGFSFGDKINIVSSLAKKYRVFISSESVLPTELETYRLSTDPDKIHDVMSAVSLFIGEGATMASECAMLGTPAIYVNSMEAGTIDDQEKFGLIYHYRNAKNVLEKANKILLNNDSDKQYIVLRDKMLDNKIDLSKFLVWFISEWPKSFKIMKENPDYQSRFK